MVQKIKILLKRLHILPVLACDIFDKALALSYDREARATCETILKAVEYFRVEPRDKGYRHTDRPPTENEVTYLYFPLHNINSAKVFGANANISRICAPNKYLYYWWPAGVWNTGRRAYLLSLAEIYKDDKRDFRKVCKKSLQELRMAK